ncbi:MAG: single-stranded DNA-binding protein [Lentisphaerae bacterium]|nr:single-stranded DNA-binding protein [Lentisphaerota bacterium]
MANLNKVLLIGNLTRDPELRYTPQGSAICDLGLAINRQYTTNDGVKKEEVCFVDITAWGRQAETCNRFVKKGSQIFVEGRLKLDSWQDKETGKNRSKINVVAERIQFLSGSGAGKHQDDGQDEQQPYQKPAPQQQSQAPRQDSRPPQQAQRAPVVPLPQVQNPPPPPEFEVDSEPDDDIPF